MPVLISLLKPRCISQADPEPIHELNIKRDVRGVEDLKITEAYQPQGLFKLLKRLEVLKNNVRLKAIEPDGWVILGPHERASHGWVNDREIREGRSIGGAEDPELA